MAWSWSRTVARSSTSTPSARPTGSGGCPTPSRPASAWIAPHIETGLPLGAYGYGVFVGKQTLGGRPVTVIQHGGTINGFTAGFWRMPDDDRVVIVLDNSMSHEVPGLTAGLAGLLYAGLP